ncbi:hypothetical protein ABVT39_010647 [Epinephelus coioides]
MDAELRDFLRKRKIPEEFIQQLENEKIDASVIPVMTDGDLAKYIPKCGDRLATVAFCRQASASMETRSRKDSILKRLRHRLVSSEVHFGRGCEIARYFPVKLAAPFLEEALYSKTTSSLKDTFIQYVSDQEREVLLKALENFDSVDSDALFDAFEAHECQQIPTKDNLIPLLSQIGHKALIQAPMYIIDCWRPIVLQLASVLPPDALHHVIQQKKPTGKAVKELLQFPDDMTPAQTAVARYLRRYVGEVDSRTLQLFLRFCTGSNLVEQPIKVEFIEMSDFERRPQSHTWVSFKAACRLP